MLHCYVDTFQHHCGVYAVCCVARLKSDDKYNTVLPRIVSLLNILSDSQSHIQAQESIAVCIPPLYTLLEHPPLVCWLCGSAVERQSLAGELSLS